MKIYELAKIEKEAARKHAEEKTARANAVVAVKPPKKGKKSV